MSLPSDPESTRKDPTDPASANPAGGTGGTAVAPPQTKGGPRNWRPLVLVLASVLAILIVLILLF